MGLPRESQIPQAPGRAPSRSSRVPVVPLKLVPVAEERPAVVPFRALKGSAPGGYVPGPPVLAPGARVGILCDTLHGDREVGLSYAQGLAEAAELLRSLGFEPVVDHAQAAVEPYFERWAGSVEQRAQHVVRLLHDYQVDAVFPLFGKGGCHGVVDRIAASYFRPRRKVALIGGFSHHSDWALFAQSALGRGFFSHVISATQCAYWRALPRENVDNLGALLRGASAVAYRGLKALNAPRAHAISGPLSGGNLSALALNRDKAWMPNLRGRIVVCEDYDRHAHDYHRSFSAFARFAEQAGAAAIVVGAMLPLKRAAHAKLDAVDREREVEKDRREIAALVQEVASRSEIPVFSQPQLCSHGAMNYPLGMGGPASIAAEADGTYTLVNTLELAP